MRVEEKFRSSHPPGTRSIRIVVLGAGKQDVANLGKSRLDGLGQVQKNQTKKLRKPSGERFLFPRKLTRRRSKREGRGGEG